MRIEPTNPQYQPLKGKKICIDPGHGGEDPGAIGVAKTNEKDVNLQVALQEKDALEKLGATVVMTRSADLPANEQLGLQTRCDIANDAKVDVFISIHHNANDKPAIKGTETYYYAKGSKESHTLAKMTQQDVVAAIETENRGAIPSNFYVLKHTNMPAILLECGYLSNKDEEKYISQPATQEKIVQGMTKAVIGWFTTPSNKMEPIPPFNPDDVPPDEKPD